MVAAREFNGPSSGDPQPVHGAVTTGLAWKFVRLTGSDLTLDRREYFATDPARILGILADILQPTLSVEEDRSRAV